jgi:ABC-2 type transport system permease protein
MLEVLQTLQGTDPLWLPSTWALDALWPHLGHATGVRTHPELLLALAGAAGFFVAGWCFRAMHFRAFSHAQEGVDTRELLGGQRRAGTGRSLDELAAIRSRRAGRHSLGRAIVAKDLRVFVRDTAQWTQMLLILALIVIYVVNFKYIRSVGDTGIITRTGLHFINLVLSGFVAVAVCVRFVFPAVSLEGRAFWMVLRSPNRVLDFLRSKWVSSTVPLVVLVNLLVLLTNLWLGAGPLLTVTAALTVTPMTIGVAGLALGLGARYPRFRVDNAAKIATGFGGVLYMILGVLTLILVVGLAGVPTMAAVRWFEHGTVSGPLRMVGTVAAGLGAIIVPLAAGAYAVRLGARRLEERGV